MDHHGLAEHRVPGVGGVAEHAPDHGAVPAGFPGAGGRLLFGEPAGEFGEGSILIGVAGEQLTDQGRFVGDNLVAGPTVLAFAQVAVAERGTAEDVDRPGAGPVGLAAAVAFQDLGFLVFDEHALELDQELVFGTVPAGAVDELHPGAGPGELLDQEGLVGELAGQAVG